MTESTRKKTELADRRQRVAEMYLRGQYQSEIANILGVDQSTISRDLLELRKEWLDRSINHIDQKKAIELAKLDQLELTYWEAWERSKLDAEVETTEQIGVKQKSTKKGKDGEEEFTIVPDRIKKNKRREGQTGDPRFLDGVMKCIERRCSILGLDAPKKSDLTSMGEKIQSVTRVEVILPPDETPGGDDDSGGA